MLLGGTWNGSDTKFCRNCGANLTEDLVNQERNKSKSKAGGIVVVIIYYIILIAIITAIIMAFK